MDVPIYATCWRLAGLLALCGAACAIEISNRFNDSSTIPALMSAAPAVFSLVATRYGFIRAGDQKPMGRRFADRFARAILSTGIGLWTFSAAIIAWQLANDALDASAVGHGIALVICILIFEALSRRLIARMTCRRREVMPASDKRSLAPLIVSNGDMHYWGGRSIRVPPGQYYDAETGTDYYDYRNHDATVGRIMFRGCGGAEKMKEG
jgi:hypothetical protein